MTVSATSFPRVNVRASATAAESATALPRANVRASAPVTVSLTSRCGRRRRPRRGGGFVGDGDGVGNNDRPGERDGVGGGDGFSGELSAGERARVRRGDGVRYAFATSERASVRGGDGVGGRGRFRVAGGGGRERNMELGVAVVGVGCSSSWPVCRCRPMCLPVVDVHGAVGALRAALDSKAVHDAGEAAIRVEARRNDAGGSGMFPRLRW